MTQILLAVRFKFYNKDYNAASELTYEAISESEHFFRTFRSWFRSVGAKAHNILVCIVPALSI
jgi:hypothetical protein